VEAEKYAGPTTDFSFTFSHASENEIAEIRRHLSPDEIRIVELKTL
jgi:hypothetical protein